jgi:hypothetical protein
MIIHFLYTWIINILITTLCWLTVSIGAGAIWAIIGFLSHSRTDLQSD